jgi:hypothetical protein
MTENEIYKQALLLMGETGTSYDAFELAVANQVIVECFNANNSILLSKSLTALTVIPTITNKTDTLIYDSGLIREVFPYGIAAKLSLQDNPTLYNAMNYEYETRKGIYSKGIVGKITDYYSSENYED